ncbi:site-specific integrase [Amycolatopsis sp. NPDC051071]|uniref:site-specific integrase n=1 Tax=Amycolatopsis sp. NPDC051071 TaxID=3154637 RepID=UPI003440106C
MLVSPELADVLSAIVQRLRAPDGSIPLVISYDIREKVWNSPTPLLFQRGIGNERRTFTPSAIRKVQINALAVTGLADVEGNPLIFQAHDFRRLFVTDAIMNGLPPHIAQIICGHKSVDTTMGYKAVYPAETIEAQRRLLAVAAPPGPAKNTAPRPTGNGTPSSLTSRNERCPLGPAHEYSDHPASMKMLA